MTDEPDGTGVMFRTLGDGSCLMVAQSASGERGFQRLAIAGTYVALLRELFSDLPDGMKPSNQIHNVVTQLLDYFKELKVGFKQEIVNRMDRECDLVVERLEQWELRAETCGQ